jgi:hypothetical protein
MKWIGQNIWDQISRFRSEVHIDGGTLYSNIDGTGTLPIIAGDITIYNAVNDGDPTISLGSSGSERLEIKAQYESGAQGLDGAIFTTYTAGSSTNDGRFTFFVDQIGTFQIRDHGINLYAGKSLQIGNTDIITDNGSGTTTLNNIDALDATTIATMETALETNIDTLGDITMTRLVLDGDRDITPGDGAILHVDTSTITDTNTAEGATASLYTHARIEGPTLAADAGSITTTDAATLYISGAPSAGTNQTLTRAHAIWVDAGNVRLDGELYMGTTRAMDSNGLLRVADQSTITGLGTISSGVWQGTAIGASYVATLNQDTTGTAATVTASAQPHIESIGTDGDILSILSDAIAMSNSSASMPSVQLTNTANDTTSPVLKMINNRGAAGQDNDLLGVIDFIGYDDGGTPAVQTYSKIYSTIHDATAGEESGKLIFQVANHDGGLGDGLILTGGSANNEIDVTLGLGANSVITIPGDIDLAGDIDVDGTLETDALTVGGVAFTPSTTKQVTHHMIGDDIDSDVVFISLGEIDAENTSAGNKHLPLIAPSAGKLLKIFVRTTVDMSSETFTWKLYTRTVSQSTNGNASEVGAQSGAGPTNKTMVTYDFTTGLDSGTNAIAAGDKVQISIEASDGGTSNTSYFITCLWEWDLS